jgi:uncharacterized protein (TIGR03435 family)
MPWRLRLACLTIVTCHWSAAQSSTNLPAFDSISIKRNVLGGSSSSWNTRTGYILMKNQTLKSLVAIAYRQQDERVSGGPKWADSERFDIEGRAAGPARDSELLLMLQRTLRERFKLVLHRENRNIDGYALVPITSGLKIQPDATEDSSGWNSTRGRIAAQHVTMTRFAEMLTRMLGRPVADMTDTKGTYSFTLEWTPESSRSAGPDAAPAEPSGPTLFDAVAQRLGLKLENKKLPAEMIVIDRAETPIEN